MPYSTFASNPRKLLRGSFEDQSFVVPYSSTPVAAPGSLSGTYNSQRFAVPPFFSQPGGMGAMGFDATWFTDPAQAILPPIAGITIPNIALVGVAALMFLGGKRRR